LAGFIDDGLLDKHIRRNRRVYAERHHIVTEALSGSLAQHLTPRTAHAGLHIATVLRPGFRENEVLQAAARHGIVVAGLSDCFHTAPAQAGLLIGFGAVSIRELPTALRMLDRVLAAQSLAS
jgi:GntR family transcriptional regulator/MocR family aminotransferase